jgi:hypothetical protein
VLAGFDADEMSLQGKHARVQDFVYSLGQERPMAYSESYTCDVCGDKKGVAGDWWLGWVDCFPGVKPEEDQPLIKLTRWQVHHAQSAGVKHLCGARCTGTLMDRWMTEQHEDPDAHCVT